MKKTFSTHWKASRQPRKQRKYTAKAPLHIKRKLLSVNLSKELRKKYNRRNIPIRKGDTAKIMSGKFRKKQGKILEVDIKKSKVVMEGIQVKKQDGSKVNVRLHPSKLQIINLNLDDKRRMNIKENKQEEKKEKAEDKIKEKIREEKK